MSADACVAYYGIRFDVDETEIEELEKRTHPRIQRARNDRLNYYWTNFGAPGDKYYLFVGTELGVLGIEGIPDICLSDADVAEIFERTKSKLQAAGFAETPALYIQFMRDA